MSVDARYKSIRGSRRSALMRLCRSLFSKGPNVEGVRTVTGMVSLLAGRQMGKRAAWIWLLDQYETGLRPPTKAKPQTDYKHVGSKAFYSSEAWRALRFDALKAGNGSCNLCGRSNRQHGIILHVDHIKPKSRFPELALDPNNLQILCEDCNLGKSNRDDTDWRTATETDRQLDAVNWREI